jgi:hypothetical protein
MATKKLAIEPTIKTTLTIEKDKNKTKERQFAEVVLSSTNINTITTLGYAQTSINGEASLQDAIAVMNESVAKVNDGDTKALEARLIAQVSSLDAIFNSLALKSIASETMSKLEVYMRLALKAQAQCARTIEVLASMKNPPLVIAKQANIAQGHQQVNNKNYNSEGIVYAEKPVSGHNKLIEANNGSTTMDISTAQSTSAKDKAMAPLEK